MKCRNLLVGIVGLAVAGAGALIGGKALYDSGRAQNIRESEKSIRLAYSMGYADGKFTGAAESALFLDNASKNDLSSNYSGGAWIVAKAADCYLREFIETKNYEGSKENKTGIYRSLFSPSSQPSSQPSSKE